MNSNRTKTLLLALAGVCWLPSCALVKSVREDIRKAETARKESKKKAAPQEPAAPKLFEWNGADSTGAPSVRINLSEQKARIFKDGKEVGWTYVATGTANHPSPTGTFYISEKVADKRSTTWGVLVDASGDVVDGEARSGRESVPSGGRFLGAPMPHWMRLTGYGIGMHGGPIPHPGRPASHGCIRLPYDMAATLFGELPSGTKVTITD